MIAEGVVSRAEHRSRLADPDGYRPDECLCCGHDRLHAHDFRERKLQGESDWETFRRYRCVLCRAVWMVLAAFMARHLHRRWSFVHAAVAAAGVVVGEVKPTVGVPRRTLRRWLERLWSSARVVVHAFVTSGVRLGGAAQAVNRVELIQSMVRDGLVSGARPLSELAG